MCFSEKIEITFIGGYLMARFLWGDNMGIEDTNPIENLFENAEDYNISIFSDK